MRSLRFEREYAFPVDRIYAHLSEHENLGALFAPAKVRRLRDGREERNGVGSARQLSVFGVSRFVETVTEAVDGERIVYRITQGGPLTDHEGVMRFTPTVGGSRLEYTIQFRSRIPLVAPLVAAALRRSISRGLDGVEAPA